MTDLQVSGFRCSPASCNGGSDGKVEIAGVLTTSTAPYTFSVVNVSNPGFNYVSPPSQSGPSFETSNLPAGFYKTTLTSSDQTPLTFTECCEIAEPQAMTVKLHVPTNTCCGTVDGGNSYYGTLFAEVDNDGGCDEKTFEWTRTESDGVTVTQISDPSSTPYFEGHLTIGLVHTVTVTCICSSSVPLTATDNYTPCSPVCMSLSALTQCSTGCETSCGKTSNQNGIEIVATAEGGIPPYMFTWVKDMETENPVYESGNRASPVNTLPSDFARVGSVYTITVVDSRGVKETTCLTAERFYASVAFELEAEGCDGGASSKAHIATVVPSGGVAPYTYDWGNGCTRPFLTNADPNKSYCVTVTDSTGCKILTKTVPCGSDRSLATTLAFYTAVVLAVLLALYIGFLLVKALLAKYYSCYPASPSLAPPPAQCLSAASLTIV